MTPLPLRQIVSNLFRRWPAGEPILSSSGDRIGTHLPDGTLEFGPDVDVSPLSGGQQDAIKACCGEADADPIAEQAEKTGLPRVALDLVGDVNLGPLGPVDPLADADQHQAKSDQQSRGELRRGGRDCHGRTGGRQQLPPSIETDLGKIKVGHEQISIGQVDGDLRGAAECESAASRPQSRQDDSVKASPFPTPDPLATVSRSDQISRMAADLVRFDSAGTEADAIRSLFGNGHSIVDIVILVPKARQAALAEIGRRATAEGA